MLMRFGLHVVWGGLARILERGFRATLPARLVAGWLAVCLGFQPALICAEEGVPGQAAPPTTSSKSVAGWTVAGAGAGFGLGLSVGLRAFDDAVDSDRKVWTTAVLAGAAGAVAGYLVGRARRSDRSPRPAAVRPGPRQDGAAAEGDTAGIGGRRPAPVLAEGEAGRFELRHVGLREMARRVVPRSGDAALAPAR